MRTTDEDNLEDRLTVGQVYEFINNYDFLSDTDEVVVVVYEVTDLGDITQTSLVASSVGVSHRYNAQGEPEVKLAIHID